MTGGSQAITAPGFAPELAVFWEALANRSLLLPWCERCDFPIWYPRSHCPQCGSGDVAWVGATGRGRIYSYTIDRRRSRAAPEPPVTPRVIAYVELDEGPRIIAHIVGCPPEAVRIGAPVQLSFPASADDGLPLVRFQIRAER